ncbi:hypothetical protein DFH06DRAFT_1354676, partial [Mycena polygramma]
SVLVPNSHNLCPVAKPLRFGIVENSVYLCPLHPVALTGLQPQSPALPKDFSSTVHTRSRLEMPILRTSSADLPSPFTNVPFEVVSEIFIHTLPDPDISPADSRAPLLLGCVCAEWRQIALNTPALWSTLSVRRPNAMGIALLSDLWLSRARGYPLAIHVYDDRITEGERETTKMFFETICRYSSRW